MDMSMINGLKQVEHDEFEIIYYASNEMINDGVFIQLSIYTNEEKFGTFEAVAHELIIKHLSNNNAEEFTLYHGLMLEPIQLYRVFKDIIELYDSNTKEDFFKIVENMSGSYTSSSMQSNSQVRLGMRAEMQDEFAFIKENI